jgi:predicted O-linked N-acetylglucosamine transferase (SPINDLY family)
MRGTVQGMTQFGRYSGTYELGSSIKRLLNDPAAMELIAAGKTNPLNRMMVGSDSNVPYRPVSDAAQKVLPELAPCLAEGVPAEYRYQAAKQLTQRNPYASLAKLVLPNFYDAQDELEECWIRYGISLDELQEAVLDPAIALEVAEFGAVDTFGLAYCGKDAKPYMQQLARIFQNYWKRVSPELCMPIEQRRRPGRFRLGYASSRLVSYNGTRWALGWLTEHSPEIETYAFNLSEKDDHISMRWRRNVDHYFHLPIPIKDAAEVIRTQDLDALIFPDVGSDRTSFQLALLRTSRYQLSSWGFPTTTGSPEIDFFLSSEDMEPANGQDHYTEKLVLLPGSGQTFPKARRPASSTKSRQEMGLPHGAFLLMAQNPMKLLPHRDKVFREITERTGKPLVICDLARLKRSKVNAVKLPFMPAADFFRVVELADVVLDSFDFTGGITTIDSLTLKNPPISCPGQFMRGRLGVPFMKQAGVGALLAKDESEYIELACDQDRLDAAKQTCYPEPIYRDLRPVRFLEEFLLSLS